MVSCVIMCSTEDAPTSSLSSAIKVSASTAGKNVTASVTAGSASAKASYGASDVRNLGADSIALRDVARVSVLHSSFVDYMVKLSAERYAGETADHASMPDQRLNCNILLPWATIVAFTPHNVNGDLTVACAAQVP